MADSLVTIARFSDLMRAELARIELEAAGIPAFVSDRAMASMAWHLTNAIGGIGVQVAAVDAERARATLAASPESLPTKEEFDEAALSAGPPEDEQDIGRADERIEFDEAEQHPTRREQDAQRALRAALLGALFLPLQFYAIWLLIKVVTSEERLSGRPRTRAFWATGICVPVTLLFLVALRLFFRR